jgi:hypothetical protein
MAVPNFAFYSSLTVVMWVDREPSNRCRLVVRPESNPRSAEPEHRTLLQPVSRWVEWAGAGNETTSALSTAEIVAGAHAGMHDNWGSECAGGT